MKKNFHPLKKICTIIYNNIPVYKTLSTLKTIKIDVWVNPFITKNDLSINIVHPLTAIDKFKQKYNM